MTISSSPFGIVPDQTTILHDATAAEDADSPGQLDQSLSHAAPTKQPTPQVTSRPAPLTKSQRTLLETAAKWAPVTNPLVAGLLKMSEGAIRNHQMTLNRLGYIDWTPYALGGPRGWWPTAAGLRAVGVTEPPTLTADLGTVQSHLYVLDCLGAQGNHNVDHRVWSAKQIVDAAAGHPVHRRHAEYVNPAAFATEWQDTEVFPVPDSKTLVPDFVIAGSADHDPLAHAFTVRVAVDPLSTNEWRARFHSYAVNYAVSRLTVMTPRVQEAEAARRAMHAERLEDRVRVVLYRGSDALRGFRYPED